MSVYENRDAFIKYLNDQSCRSYKIRHASPLKTLSSNNDFAYLPTPVVAGGWRPMYIVISDYVIYMIEEVGDKFTSHELPYRCDGKHAIEKDSVLYECCHNMKIYNHIGELQSYLNRMRESSKVIQYVNLNYQPLLEYDGVMPF